MCYHPPTPAQEPPRAPQWSALAARAHWQDTGGKDSRALRSLGSPTSCHRKQHRCLSCAHRTLMALHVPLSELTFSSGRPGPKPKCLHPQVLHWPPSPQNLDTTWNVIFSKFFDVQDQKLSKPTQNSGQKIFASEGL